MRIAIGSDHVGFPLKASIVEVLEGEEHAVLDLGTHSPDPVDYPSMTKAVATSLVKGFVDFGVIVCETSLGAAIAANKFAGIRAVACPDADSARHSRVRLNANFLCLTGSDIDGDGAVAIVKEWLSAAFSGDERTVRELAGIDEIADGARNGKRGGRGHEKPAKVAPRPPVEAHAPVMSPPPIVAAAPVAPPPPPPPSPVERSTPPPVAAEPMITVLRDEVAAPRREEPPAPAPSPVEEAPAPVPSRVPDISAVLRFLASLKDEDIRLMARRVLEVIRNRFPAAEGAPGAEGFTFTLEGKHVATVIIAKRHIELEVGPDRVVTGRIRDLDGFQHALSLPSVMKAFDALRSS